MDLSGKRLLLIKPSSLGDVVHAVPTAWALKERWPTLHLTWLVNRGFESLVKPVACVDDTLPFDRNRFRGVLGPVSRRGEFRSFTTRLREGRFDVVLDMQGLFRSGLFAWLTGASTRIGDRKARELAWMFYTDRVQTPEQPVHARDRYTRLAGRLEAVPGRQDLDVRETERESVRGLLERNGFDGGPIVAVCPGARWESKVYPAESFAAVLDTLASSGVRRPVLVGGSDVEQAGKQIMTACRNARPLNLIGETGLRELTALLDLADLAVTCDSGPMHIAAAQSTPVVAVFGSTDPVRTGPFGQLQNVVQGSCDIMPCLRRHCPGRGQMCLRDLDPARIAEKALALLAQTADK